MKAALPILLALASFGMNDAAEVDASKLPPPASVQIDFGRDVRPIFEASCLRCHGAQKPKSGFRLDNRVSALKGGDDGVDIIPGSSAKSPLIHYVAGLVEDMKMPPEGKGDPLTPGQVGLLRAWIDQGANWDNAAGTNFVTGYVSTTVGGVIVDGDRRTFREHNWRPTGVDGGVTGFELFDRFDPNTSMTTAGHFSVDDYKLTLDVDRTELGFVHSGWQQYRQYYDDTGGFFPGSPILSLDRDLGLEIGKAWIDFGLTLPHWPRMVFGYEFDYKRGNEATTAWGSNAAPGDPRNVAPNSKHLNEGVHIIKFDVDADVAGVAIEDRFRGEFYDLKSAYTNLAARASIGQDVNDHVTYFQGANSLRAERRFKDWLFASGGYFFSRLESDDSFSDLTTASSGQFLATAPNIHLSRESHLFNLNGLIGPFDGLSFTADVQSEWTRQHGFALANLNGIAFTRPPGSNLQINPATLSSDYDQSAVWEQLGVHYTKIPYTSLFAEGRLRQESIGQYDADLQPAAISFVERPTYSNQLADMRAGFNTSPWEKISFSGHYRRYDDESRYRTNTVPEPVGGYPGFLSRREVLTDEFEAKVTTRPFRWLKASVSYQYQTTDFKENTRPAFDVAPLTVYSPGGPILAGRTDAHIFGLSGTFTPVRRFYFTTTFSYQNTLTETENGEIVPSYRGDIYSVLATGTFIIDEKTDFTANYSVSLADYSDSNTTNPAGPPPLGIRYDQHAVQAAITRHFTKRVSGRLQYGYYLYNEPTLLSVNDYSVHAIFTTVTVHF